MLTNAAAVVFDGVTPFEFAVLCESFGVDRTEHGVPLLDFAVCAATEEVRTSLGFGLRLDHGLDRLEQADLIGVPAYPFDTGLPAQVLEALRAAHRRGARILGLCSGTFALGEAGLLDGRRCTTHWMYSDRLRARFPLAQVLPEVLYVDEGSVVTAAGTAAGIDACLHIWRQEYGASVASAVARRMVVAPQRSGGQAQFIPDAVTPVEADTLAPVMEWMVGHLADDLSVEQLARHALMSARTFARRFRAETGTTPHAWVTRQRVLRAEELLERTELPIESIAVQVGFSTSAALRHHFTRLRGVPPVEYRKTFWCAEERTGGGLPNAQRVHGLQPGA